MSGPHLGTRVTPYVDGRLASDAEARVREHLRACPGCAEEVEAERLVKARVQMLQVPELSDDLVVRLLEIGGPSGPLRPRDKPMAVPARPVVGVAPPSRTDPRRVPGASRPGARRLRRRPVTAALAGTFSLLGAGIVGVLVIGGLPSTGGQAPVAELRTTPSASATSTSSSVPVARRVDSPDASASPTSSASGTATASPTAAP